MPDGWPVKLCKAPGSGLSATFSSESLVPSLAVGSFRNSASTSARALSRRSSTPPAGRCYCCWSSGSFVAEAGGIEVGAEVGEDAGNRRLAGRSFGGSLEGRAFWRVEIWKRRTIERAPYQEPHRRGLAAGRSWDPVVSPTNVEHPPCPDGMTQHAAVTGSVSV